MTIKEIAEMANVSVSTVSKVINKKDESISAETREKILNIVKKYHYSPYRPSEESKPSLILGVLIGESADYGLITGIVKRARTRGYSTIVCTSSSADEEIQNFEILAAHHVDGIIWNKEPYSSATLPSGILSSAKKIRTLNSEEKASVLNTYFSYSDMGYTAARHLIEKGHKKIGCISADSIFSTREFVEGIRRCLFDNQVFINDDSIWRNIAGCDPLWLQAHTGVICFDSASINKIALMADFMNIRVPQDMSVIGIDSGDLKIAGINLASISRPFEELGAYSADSLIDEIETGKTSYSEFSKNYTLSGAESIAAPKKAELGHFVVIGTINVDTLMSVDKQPEPGETINIKHRAIMPGGKGLNQAVGVSKLGAFASLISSLGNDYYGHQVFECLKLNSVCTDGIVSYDDIPTGHAYIYIQKNAESNISVFDGANGKLTENDLDKYEHLFENTDFCLLQTELKQSIVLHAAKIARRHNAKVILKPCAVTSLMPELLKSVDILIPNIKEAGTLLPDVPSLEGKAKRFLELGVETVIITMGDKGCFLADGRQLKYFPAARISPVDTTGAADAFISALAFYLTLGKSMEEAIKYATCAAGLSTTRHGVPPALVDRETLELYYSEHQEDFGEMHDEETGTGIIEH